MSKFQVRLVSSEGSIRREAWFEADDAQAAWSKLRHLAEGHGAGEGALVVRDQEGDVVIRVGIATALKTGGMRPKYRNLRG